MIKSLFRPTFAIFERFRTATNFAFVCGVLLVAQLGALALFFFATLELLPDTGTALVVVGSVLFLVGIYGQLSRLIIYRYAQPSLIRLLSRFAEGDLSLQFLPGWGKSEGQSLWTELNRMNKEFPNLIRQIRASAQTVANGSREIAQGYVDLSRRTDEQSNTLRDVATSVEEISATAKHNADSCRRAEGVICEVGERAEEAARSMQQVTGTMSGIEAATKKVAEFVGIVQNIAFQTNILALNAAVESARAGEQGRGFAVVAAEVRALAQRSAEATDKIKALIASSSQNVSESSALVTKAEQAVDAAAVQIRRVIELIVSVAAASSEQDAGVQSMARALSHLDSVTQENAALVHKGKEAAESFGRASERLVDSTRAFRLPEQGTADDDIVVGSFRTLVRNLRMGPIVRTFVLLPIGISVSLSSGLGAIVFALPLLTGVLLTFLAAFGPLHANLSTAGGDVSALVTVGLPIVTVAVFLVGTYLYFSFTEWQNRGAAWMQSISTRLASGDLTWKIKLVESAEADRIEVYGINRALFEIKRNFVNVVSEVRASADAIAAGSHEIAQGYNNLSQRTETQAATLEETAASIEELTATVRQNAEHCRAANSGVEEVRASAEQASHAMQKVTSTMAGMEQSARQMVEFVAIVESIAFQTNILALNAAVEASRAGDQGRGFAVVAAEVRALAQRSAEATEQIKTLIDDSVRRVSEGASIISQAEQTVGRAVTGIHEAAELIESIATTSVDQSSGMERIASSLARLESSTQQNAALVEEGAAVSASFEQEGVRLAEGVRVFRLDTQERTKETAPPPNDLPQESIGNAPSLRLISRTGTG